MARASNEAYRDPNTYSNYKDVYVVHTDIDWEVHFSSKQLKGSVEHTIKRLNPQSTSLLLDSYDLDIKRITHWTAELPFTLSPRVESDPPAFGRCLNIDLTGVKYHDTRDENEKKSSGVELNDTAQIKIEYVTSSSAEAIQWLDASITDGGKLPFLFTQCQPIGARTMLPCQDTPGSKFTYSATIKTPKKLENGSECLFTTLMSAPTSDEFTKVDNKSDANWTIHKIVQPRKIPSYLLALVVGDLAQEVVGNEGTCSVVTEPVNMKAVKWEFENMQSYKTIGESFCGKYRWATYGCLVLPSSFPYGGMENPNLTFVTPTLIAGDRSLVNVVAHEITHSWSGNLVTNESWEHFWLNEGWTRFIEMKIMQRKVTIDKEAEKLKINKEEDKFIKIDINKVSKESFDYGVRYQALQYMNGKTALQGSLKLFGADHEFTKLALSLKAQDPDDAFSSVPYEKGSELLLYLEDLVGGPKVFNPFISKYFDEFAEKSIGYQVFQKFLIEYFRKLDAKLGETLEKSVVWDMWLHKPGMPSVRVEDTLISHGKKLGVDNIFGLIEEVDALVTTWTSMKNIKDVEDNNKIANGDMNGWSVDQKEMFLDRMLDNAKGQIEKKEISLDVLRAKLAKMNDIYGFYKKTDAAQEKAVGNREILFRFFLLVLEFEEDKLYQDVVTQMLSCVGRMKYVRPLYRALAGKNFKLAEESFAKYRATQYHPICAKMVQKDLDKARPQ